MSGIETVLASGFQTAAVLTLVLPAVVLIAVAIWYIVLWLRTAASGSGADTLEVPPRVVQATC